MKTSIQFLTIILVLTGCHAYSLSDQSTPPIPSQEEPQVLNEGPIHEAFAQPIDLAPQAGIISPNEPPPDIVENPASEKPKGSEYVWIPGYWGWDTERSDYIWISGCWRKPPTNMSWIPGYWHKVSNGWQWVAGFWIPTNKASQIEYLPKPPEVADNQPPTGQDVEGSIWVPPCYYWSENSYILRPGYWLVPQDNWVWIPSHYTWTPYGYVFVAGYWDSVPATRGILYAPVYFPGHFHRPPDYTYPLSVVVDIGELEFCLFSYPRYCHYYFGDYYSDSYISLGIYPWFEFETRHTWYDPIFEYDRWHYRKIIPHWREHIRNEYDMRRADKKLRPPKTYHELETRFSKIPEVQRSNFGMVKPLRNYIKNKDASFAFSRMTTREHGRISNQADKVNHFRQERMHIESENVPEAIQQPAKPAAPEQNPSVPSGTRERPTTTGPPESENPGEHREFHRRENFENRTSPERKDIPSPPVSGKTSGGLFSRRAPSRPDGERRFEHGKTGEPHGGRHRR